MHIYYTIHCRNTYVRYSCVYPLLRWKTSPSSFFPLLVSFLVSLVIDTSKLYQSLSHHFRIAISEMTYYFKFQNKKYVWCVVCLSIVLLLHISNIRAPISCFDGKHNCFYLTTTSLVCSIFGHQNFRCISIFKSTFENNYTWNERLFWMTNLSINVYLLHYPL